MGTIEVTTTDRFEEGLSPYLGTVLKGRSVLIREGKKLFHCFRIPFVKEEKKRYITLTPEEKEDLRKALKEVEEGKIAGVLRTPEDIENWLKI